MDTTFDKNILNKYHFSDTSDDGTTAYFGFVDTSGNWYILKLTSSAARYCSGTYASTYSANWTNRDALSYGYYNDTF